MACLQADDPRQTLYGSLRDLWAALEVRLAEALPDVVALVGQARDGAREARHRQDHLRDALRDTHDALARATAERNRTKQLTADLQVRFFRLRAWRLGPVPSGATLVMQCRAVGFSGAVAPAGLLHGFV